MKFSAGTCTQCGFVTNRLLERPATKFTPATRLCAYCERERWERDGSINSPAPGKEDE